IYYISYRFSTFFRSDVWDHFIAKVGRSLKHIIGKFIKNKFCLTNGNIAFANTLFLHFLSLIDFTYFIFFFFFYFIFNFIFYFIVVPYFSLFAIPILFLLLFLSFIPSGLTRMIEFVFHFFHEKLLTCIIWVDAHFHFPFIIGKLPLFFIVAYYILFVVFMMAL